MNLAGTCTPAEDVTRWHSIVVFEKLAGNGCKREGQPFVTVPAWCYGEQEQHTGPMKGLRLDNSCAVDLPRPFMLAHVSPLREDLSARGLIHKMTCLIKCGKRKIPTAKPHGQRHACLALTSRAANGMMKSIFDGAGVHQATHISVTYSPARCLLIEG